MGEWILGRAMQVGSKSVGGSRANITGFYEPNNFCIGHVFVLKKLLKIYKY